MVHTSRAKTKGRLTREAVVARSAELFNARGFEGTSISAVLEATGLEKGGLYNHFASKDELALAAFEHAVKILEAQHRKALAAAPTAATKLLAVVDGFALSASQPLLAGGCPLLNTAVRSTGAHPKLHKRAREAVQRVLGRIAEVVFSGIASGEFRADASPETVASVLLGSLEGAVMLSRLYDDYAHMRRAKAHLRTYIDGLATA